MILDIHSHRKAPYDEGIISCSPEEYYPLPGQLYSVGIHPWSTGEDFKLPLELLSKVASDSQVVAIGEGGVDTLKGGPLFQQLQTFKACVDLSEQLQKPLIIHCVKAYDIIAGLHRDLTPKQQWIIHGFRGKPSVAKQLTDKGIALSYGERFNADSLKVTPSNFLFAETDESLLSIEEIIGLLSESYGEELQSKISKNINHLLSKRSI